MEETHNQQQVPAYAHAASSTPVEGYLDDSFLDRTSPRLKEQAAGEAQMPPPARRLVPREGAVIVEVVVRHRVMNKDGRDYGAVVRTVVPSGHAFGGHEKVVGQLNVPGPQAGEIAVLLTDTIAAMAYENGIMVPEDRLRGGGIGQGFPLDPSDPLGGLGFMAGNQFVHADKGPFSQFFGPPPEIDLSLFFTVGARAAGAPEGVAESFLEKVGGFFLNEGMQMGLEAHRTGNYEPIIAKAQQMIMECPAGAKRDALLELFYLFLKHQEVLIQKKPTDAPDTVLKDEAYDTQQGDDPNETPPPEPMPTGGV